MIALQLSVQKKVFFVPRSIMLAHLIFCFVDFLVEVADELVAESNASRNEGG